MAGLRVTEKLGNFRSPKSSQLLGSQRLYRTVWNNRLLCWQYCVQSENTLPTWRAAGQLYSTSRLSKERMTSYQRLKGVSEVLRHLTFRHLACFGTPTLASCQKPASGRGYSSSLSPWLSFCVSSLPSYSSHLVCGFLEGRITIKPT
jgi:hypothetical protein